MSLILNIYMFASVSIYDDNNLLDKVDIDYIDNKNDFSYLDNQNNKCAFKVYKNGLIFEKQANDYSLYLNLLDNPYTKVITGEGELKLDTKVVDYYLNDDILVVHYLIDGDRKQIVINYRS